MPQGITVPSGPADIGVIVKRVASLARELGSSASALRRAADRLRRELGYEWWLEDQGRIRLTTALGRKGYVYVYQSRTLNGYRNLVGETVDQAVTSDPISPTDRLRIQILPPGEHPFPAILDHFQVLAKENPGVEYDRTRLERLNSLRPASTSIGVDEFEGYCVFCFQDSSVVVLECPWVGNAVYVIPKNGWKTLCQRSKAELLARHRGIKRIVHAGNWFERVKASVMAERPKGHV